MPDEQVEKTQIQIRVKTAERLKKLVGFNESYDDVITRLLDAKQVD